MIQDGTYLARGNTWGLGKAKTGSEQVAIEFRFMTDEGERSLTWFGYFTDGTIERTIESLRTCGWKGQDLSDLSGLDANEVQIVVENEEWEGKVRPKVKWINKAGGLALADPLDAGSAKAFAARMKGAVLAFDQKSGTPKPPRPPRSNGSQQPDPPPHTNDDIPF